jgi:hypothetical protein
MFGVVFYGGGGGIGYSGRDGGREMPCDCQHSIRGGMVVLYGTVHKYVRTIHSPSIVTACAISAQRHHRRSDMESYPHATSSAS